MRAALGLLRAATRRLIGWLAGRDHRDAVLGDLEEEWDGRDAWYLREAASLARGLAVERLREWIRTLTRRWGMWRMGTGLEVWAAEAHGAVRAIRRRPGGSALVALTLGVAVGGVTTVFSLVHAAWLRPLPWPDDQALVRIFSGYGSGAELNRTAVAPEVLRSVVDASPAVREAGAWTIGETVHMLRGSEAVRLEAPRASAGLFRVLGVEPELGRLLEPADEEPGAAPVVVLSRAFWVSAFGADPAVVGTTVELDGTAHRVVGVAPDRAAPVRPDVWRPLALGPEWFTDGRLGWEMLEVVGRLAPGTDAQAARRALHAELQVRAPDRVEELSQTVVVVPLREEMLGATGPALLGLLAAAALVVLVACANVTTLLMARFDERARELAVRRSLGAPAGALARLVLVESAVATALGGVLGLGLARLGLWGLERANVELLAPLRPLEISGAVMLFTLAVVGGTALLVGLGPALRTRRVDAGEGVRAVVREGGSRSHGARSSSATRRLLVVGEIGLALALMVGVGVALRGLSALTDVDPGFRPDGLLTAELEAPAGRGGVERAALWEAIDERIAALPGVEGAGLTYALPLTGTRWSGSFGIEAPDADQADMEPGANMRAVSPGYFEAAGIDVIEGRTFTAADGAGASPVAVVDEAVARRFWPGRSPVGRRIRLGQTTSAEPATIVGVVEDVRDQGLHAPGSGHVYFPLAVSPQRSMTLVARASGDPSALAGAVRAAVREVDPAMPVVSLAPATARVAKALAGPRLGTLVLGAFGLLAAVLAGIGIFGVVAWTVHRRTPEIGTRVALGATRSDVLSLVLGQVVRLWAAGAVLGLAGGVGVATILDRVVPGGAAVDAPVLLVTAAGMGALALLAALVPAGRALSVDAVDALRGG